jgi:hypothetical protein
MYLKLTTKKVISNKNVKVKKYFHMIVFPYNLALAPGANSQHSTVTGEKCLHKT